MSDPEAKPLAAGEADYPISRGLLIEQGRKFLEEDGTRNAPLAQKRAFLERKGLTSDEIEALMEPKSEISSPTNPPSKPQSSEGPSSILSRIDTETPPIITYPEFLMQPPASPLLTAQRVLQTVYLASSAALTLYGANKYVMEPLIEKMNEARHSLALTAVDNLTKLNTKLVSTVTEVPKTGNSFGIEYHGKEDAVSTTSIESDPTELFHVDVGTQTSDVHSQASSVCSDPLDGLATLNAQESKLKELHQQLSDLLDENNDRFGDEIVESTVQQLTKYLDNLYYTSPYYSKNSKQDGITASGNSRTNEVDEIARVKAEIISIKGVLLSARNFPASGGRAR
ncbi:MAG: hypothetical protein M1824_005267 [Vezdaea acicularis]|nr:MAG: hypothetical protein M1824_005267 [Vezdaea acicularis]